MTAPAAKGYAYNRTRKTYLATDLAVANTHWSRLMGLMGTSPADFPAGKGLWIVPCRGVHSLAMRFPIDVIYLDKAKLVVHVEHNLLPWRLAPVRWKATTILELPPSTVNQTNTAIGDEIEIEFEKSEAATA
jgi:uncharacterized membrane protein (UPF0127 family)